MSVIYIVTWLFRYCVCCNLRLFKIQCSSIGFHVSLMDPGWILGNECLTVQWGPWHLWIKRLLSFFKPQPSVSLYYYDTFHVFLSRLKIKTCKLVWMCINFFVTQKWDNILDSHSTSCFVKSKIFGRHSSVSVYMHLPWLDFLTKFPVNTILVFSFRKTFMGKALWTIY